MSHTTQEQLDQDARDLQKMGYTQELLRKLGGFSNFAVSFSVISILTGATQLYGYGLQHGGPLQMSLGWTLVSLFTMTVALSMAELASAYPTAGALYHWATYLGGKRIGWFTACFNTIGMFAIMAGIDYGLAQFLTGLLQLPTSYTSGLYFFLLFSHASLNHIGIRLVSWLNNFSAWYHMGVVIYLFAALAFAGFVQPLSFLGTFNSTDSTTPFNSFLIGLLLAQWTLTGYDASAHVTEETVDPRRNSPRGIFTAVIVSVVFGFLMLAAVTLSIPDLAQATAFGDRAFSEIMKLRLGETQGNFMNALIAGAMWLCGLATMTSASRMVYAFARDGGLPYSKVWAKISPGHKTPANAIWGLSVFALFLVFSVDVYSAVVSIATIALYISYGLPILARLYARAKGTDHSTGPWNLGKFSTFNAVIALAWILFITTLFVLPPNDQAGKVIAVCTVVLVAIWGFRARTHFKGPKITL